MTDDLERINKELFELQSLAKQGIEEFSEAVKRAYATGSASENDRQGLRDLATKNLEIGKRIEQLIEQATAMLPPGLLEDVLGSDDRAPAQENRLRREDLTAHVLPSDADIDDYLPDALDNLMRIVNPAWLEAEATKPYRLDSKYRKNTLSLVGGRRADNPGIHRFAHDLLVAKDFLDGAENYDFHMGALYVPELTALGSALPLLDEVKGDTKQRIADLAAGPSTGVEGTIYELLVACGCVRQGRETEFVETGQDKSPDIRLHDFGVPTVVECKRKQFLTEYERAEEIAVRALFDAMHLELTRFGASGILEVTIRCEVRDIAPPEFAEIVRRAARFAPNVDLHYQWGDLMFIPLPRNGDITPCRLYSPYFLETVFGWDYDMPAHDGLTCRVSSPETLTTDAVTNPVAMKWTSASERAVLVKARLMGSLLKSACDQVPLGEMGIVYLCYQEGGRPEIANERTEAIIKQISGWWHRAGIVIPVIVLQRLYPRALSDGSPDLIENCVNLVSDHADPEIVSRLPSLVFLP